MPFSPIVAVALRLRDQVALEHQDYVLAYEDAAEEACRGRLLNRRGMRLGMDHSALFSGPGHYARRRAYASEELLEYLAANPFMDLATYEQHAAELMAAQLGV